MTWGQRKWVLCAGVSVLVAGCMPSEYAYLKATPEKHSEWMNGCENDPDLLARARFCDLVAKSDLTNENDYLWALQSAGNAYYEQGNYQAALDAYQAAVNGGETGDVYGNLAYAHEKLGNFEEAIENYQIAFKQTRDGDYLTEAGLLDEAMLAASDYNITFNGFFCNAVQEDSRLHQANEVVIQFISQDVLGEGGAIQLPRGGKYYENVKAGTKRGGGDVVFYPDPFAPATLSVVMWEHDTGGPMVDAAVMYGSMFAAGAAGGKVSQKLGSTAGTRVPAKLPPGQFEQGSPSPTNVHNTVSSFIKDILGTSNDFMGRDDVMNIIAADIYETDHKRENEIYYHFKTRHRAGGSDCSVYFLVGASSPDQYGEWQRRVNDYIDAAVEKN